MVVNKKRVSVTREVYKAYYCCRDWEKYLDQLSEKNNLSLEGCLEKGISVEYTITSAEDSVEDEIIMKEMIAKMAECFAQLDIHERELIRTLYFLRKSERQLSKETGVPPMTINNRKRKVLKKLKKLMER